MNPADQAFKKEFPVRHCEPDSHGNVSLVTLLHYLQDTAELYAAQPGSAVTVLRGMGLTWAHARFTTTGGKP